VFEKTVEKTTLHWKKKPLQKKTGCKEIS